MDGASQRRRIPGIQDMELLERVQRSLRDGWMVGPWNRASRNLERGFYSDMERWDEEEQLPMGSAGWDTGTMEKVGMLHPWKCLRPHGMDLAELQDPTHPIPGVQSSHSRSRLIPAGTRRSCSHMECGCALPHLPLVSRRLRDPGIPPRTSAASSLPPPPAASRPNKGKE